MNPRSRIILTNPIQRKGWRSKLLNRRRGVLALWGGLAPLTQTMPVVASGPTYYLHDTFTDTNSTSLSAHTMDTGPGWSSSGSAAIINSNRADITSTGVVDRLTANAGHADGTLMVDCVIPNETTYYQGILFRSIDANNEWRFVVERDGAGPYVAMVEFQTGAQTVRATEATGLSWITGATGTATITLAGTSISCTYTSGANTVTLTYSSAQWQTETYFGFYQYTNTSYKSGQIDNFSLVQ